jgi:hypothetical protein
MELLESWPLAGALYLLIVAALRNTPTSTPDRLSSRA